MKFVSPLRSIRGRLLIVAVLVEAVMLTALVANSLRLLTSLMETQAHSPAEQIAPVLLAAIVAPLAQRDYATVQAVLDESRAVKGIEYLVITDTSGHRQAASGWPNNQPLPSADRHIAHFDFDTQQPRHDVKVPITAFGQPMGELQFGLDLSQIIAANNDLFKQGILIALIEIILSACLMSLLGYFLTRHLSALTQASEAVASGNLTPPPVAEGNDDIGQLGAAFNAMSRTIAERIEELTLARDEAKRLAQAAEAGARAKTSFLATMSHEIRTPMNGILGMTDLTLDTELTAEQREYLNWVKISGESLLKILNDILDFSKIDAGHLNLEHIPFQLSEVINSVVGIYSVEASNHGLSLTWQADNALPAYVRGDPVRLRQILNNLLSNALKFTQQGAIHIHVASRPGNKTGECCLHLQISDSGIGIPPDKIDMIFSPFAQAESFTTRKYGGTGLGLSIVAQLVELLEGTIRVESEVGKGSTFWFTAKLNRIKEGEIVQKSTMDLRGYKALVVDDNFTARQVLSDQLNHLSFLVTQAESGNEAIKAIELAAKNHKPFDIVFIDWKSIKRSAKSLNETDLIKKILEII